jgi:TolA-binding protein
MKKIRTVWLIAGLLPVLAAVQSASADTAADLKEAQGLYDSARYAQAEALYKRIITDNPRTEAALDGQRSLAMLYARMGKDALLIQVCEGLIANYGQRQDLPAILGQVVDECRNANRHSAAASLCQYLVQHWPKQDKAIFHQAHLVACQVCLKDEAAANAAFEKLQTQYGDHPEYRQAVLAIGDNLRWRDIRPDVARQMYTLAASGEPWPDAILARMGLAISCIRLKDYDAAQAAIGTPQTDFSSDTRLGQALCHIGDAYRSQRRHGDARLLYQHVIDNRSGDDYAMWSQVGVAVSAIDAKDEQTAEAAVEKLRTDHDKRADFAAAVCVVADNYRWREGFANAKDLYALGATAASNHRQGIWLQMGLAICSTCINEPNIAEAAIAKLHSQYRNDPGLAQALYEVGATFASARQYEKAIAEFNQVISTWPDSEYVMLAKVGLGLIQVGQGDDSDAEAIFEKMLNDCRDHPKFAQAVHLMAEAHFNRAMALEQEEAKRVGSAKYAEIVRQQEQSEGVKRNYQKAIEKWRIIIEDLPPSPYTVQAWYFTGVIYRRHLGQPEKALPYYEKVISEWPDYDYAWSAQAMIAKCYERLKDAGKVPPPEAEPKIEQAYKAVVEKYPTCPLVKEACFALGRMNMEKQNWEEAAKYYTEFLERYPRTKEWPTVLLYLGITYERRGQTDAATMLYRTYLDISDPTDSRVNMVKAKLETMEGAEK